MYKLVQIMSPNKSMFFTFCLILYKNIFRQLALKQVKIICSRLICRNQTYKRIYLCNQILIVTSLDFTSIRIWGVAVTVTERKRDQIAERIESHFLFQTILSGNLPQACILQPINYFLFTETFAEKKSFPVLTFTIYIPGTDGA